MTSVLTCVHITKAAINIGINNNKNGEIFDKSVFIFLGVKVFIFFLIIMIQINECFLF